MTVLINQLYLECESIMKGYVAYGLDKREDLGWKEVNEKEEQYSGRSPIFPK